jgi:hypothetical protein
MANWVYTAISLELTADIVLRFEDDIWTLHRQDARKSNARYYTAHLRVLDEWGLTVAPEKVSAGVIGQDAFQFLGFQLEGHTIHIEPHRLGHRLWRTLQFIEAHLKRHDRLPTMRHLNRMHNRFLGYYAPITNREAVRDWLQVQTRRMLRLCYAKHHDIPFIAAQAFLSNEKLNA